MTLTGELKLGATKCDEEITIPLPLNDSGSAKGLGSIPSRLSNDSGSAKARDLLLLRFQMVRDPPKAHIFLSMRVSGSLRLYMLNISCISGSSLLYQHRFVHVASLVLSSST